MLHDELKKLGYDQEEEYFFKLNRELIEKHRSTLNQTREAQKGREERQPFWMKCPKCGHDLVETEVSGIKIDQCRSCSGVFLDSGELNLLLHAQESHHFLDRIKKLWKG